MSNLKQAANSQWPGAGRVLRILGLLIGMGAFVFVGSALHQSFQALHQQIISRDLLLAVAFCAVVYGTGLQLVGLAWYRLLAAGGDVPLGIGQALVIFGQTQIYKYIPSNILHMVGRFAAARKAGVSAAALTYAQVAEVAIIAFAAGALAATFSAPVLSKALTEFGVGLPELTVASIAIALAAMAVVVFCFLRRKAGDIGVRAISVSAQAFLLYLAFFAVNGLIIFILACSLPGLTPLDVPGLIGIGAAAWLIGFIVPGAPGGLGVREAVMIMGLSAAGQPVWSATAIALGHRFVTILGDGIVALCGLAARTRSAPTA